MVEVFRTNVASATQSDLLVQELLYYFPSSNINFDLDDCDKILRVAAESFSPNVVIDILKRNGYEAEVLS
jgi:hypothetical protein